MTGPRTTTRGWHRQRVTIEVDGEEMPRLSRGAHATRIYRSWAAVHDAEQLRDLLVAHPLDGNQYYHDAVQRADELCAEMTDDVDFEIQYALADGYDFEDFE